MVQPSRMHLMLALFLILGQFTLFAQVANDDPAAITPELKTEIEGFIKDFSNDNYKIRDAAIDGLVRIGEPCMDSLAVAAHSKDLEVMLRAKLALDAIRADIFRKKSPFSPSLDKAYPGIYADLENSDSQQKFKVLQNISALRKKGKMKEDANDKDLTRIIASMLTDNYAELSMIDKIRVLSIVTGGGAEPDGEPLFNDKVRGAAPFVIRMLSDSDENIRMFTILALAEINYKQAVADIIPSLGDPLPGLRGAAVNALGTLKAIEAKDEMVKLLNDPEFSVRGEVIMSLGMMGCTDAGPEVAPMLDDPEPYVRRSAVQYISSFRLKEFAPQVKKLLNDPDPEVKTATLGAMRLLDMKDTAKDIIQLLGDPSPMVREYALRSLGDMKVKEAVKKIVPMLKDKDVKVRYSAAATLKEISSPESAKAMIPLLLDNDEYVCGAAIDTLGNLRHKEASKEIFKLAMQDDSMYLKEKAIFALGNIGATEYKDDIAKFLGKGNYIEIRKAAAGVMGALGGKEYSADVEKLLQSEFWACKAWAGLSIVEFGMESKITPDIRDNSMIELFKLLYSQDLPAGARMEKALLKIGKTKEELDAIKRTLDKKPD